MPINSNHVDLIVQYALLLAGEEEEYFDRQLGPIHLVKYVYLADISHARRHSGESFTGARWKFHNFGPWDAEVFERIEPSANAVNAEISKFQSDYGDSDWVRYRLNDSARLTSIERQIPAAITIHLSKEVHKFLGDTPTLLDYVYKTKPMLRAAPGEFLDLSLVTSPRRESERGSSKSSETSIPEGATGAEIAVLRMEQVSNKKRKRLKEKIKQLRRHRKTKPKLVDPVTSPRYDDVFANGIAWLEELAGTLQLESGEVVAEFSDDVWKSKSRTGQDVP